MNDEYNDSYSDEPPAEFYADYQYTLEVGGDETPDPRVEAAFFRRLSLDRLTETRTTMWRAAVARLRRATRKVLGKPELRELTDFFAVLLRWEREQ